ncbi:unnamed protein product [Dicrocoelium dendriticum]|nr:unnamed protein product [Dicrocoelium dendriticum]
MFIETPGSAIDFLENMGVISKYGWKARFDNHPEVHCRPFNFPRLSQLKQFIPMSIRYTFKYYLRKRFIERRQPFLDPTKHVPWNPIYGVPMGGIGCGAIGRGFRGEFIRSSLIPGMYSYEEQPADQFILTIKSQNITLYQRVLSPRTHASGCAPGLRDWLWGFPTHHGHYVGLYPRAWTVYEIPDCQLLLVCQQISPVIPHDYKSSCLPACVFVWTAFNFGVLPLDVSISFSWHGPTPTPRSSYTPVSRSSSVKPSSRRLCNRFGAEEEDEFSDHSTQNPSNRHSFQSCSFSSDQTGVFGCLLDRLVGDELPCCFGIACKSNQKVTVRRCPGFWFNREPNKSNSSGFHDAPFSHSATSVDGAVEEPYHFLSYQNAPSAQTIWNELQSEAGLRDVNSDGFRLPNIHAFREHAPQIAMMVSGTCTVPPFKTPVKTSGDSPAPGRATFEFAVVWHSPVVRFRANGITYRRRYARWYPQPGMLGAECLLEHALMEWPNWVKKIKQWQDPVLKNESLPDWYKSALFNELYYFTDGGAVWLDPIRIGDLSISENDLLPIDFVRADKKKSNLDPFRLTGRHLSTQDKTGPNVKLECWKHRCQLGREMGLFAYLEGHEYRMFNTVDVHYYASCAFIKLWPKLQLAINYDCADLTLEEDTTKTYFIHEGHHGFRNLECFVPHDFGEPENEPWRITNAYIMFPTDSWKDLAPKFILQTWRDWKHTQDYYYLLYMLPIVYRIIRLCLSAWDKDGDGVIENSGFPDQTFDTWKTTGMSAYTGGLWVACLYGAHDMLEKALSTDSPFMDYLAQNVADNGTPWTVVEQELFAALQTAKAAYDKVLWTGNYYAYQSSPIDDHDAILSAQLCGHWFLRTSGAPTDAILPRDHVLATLETIRDNNWLSIQNGAIGAINATLPDRKRTLHSVQAEEFWVGINYALAATMIMENMTSEGLALAGACYNTIYHRFGLQYQTPEGYLVDGRFRCPGYMRPLAIWSIQTALELKQSRTNTVNEGNLRANEVPNSEQSARC